MKLNINGKLGCGTVKAWQTDNIKIDLEMRQCSDSLRCGNIWKRNVNVAACNFNNTEAASDVEV